MASTQRPKPFSSGSNACNRSRQFKILFGGILAGCTVCGVRAAPQHSSDQLASNRLQTFTIVVPRHYGAPNGTTVALRVGIARALNSAGRREPIFVVEALGESGVDAAGRGLLDSLQSLHREHDLVFVDQRGASVSPLLCPPLPSQATIAEQTAPIFDSADTAGCLASFARNEDWPDLNSHTFAEDLESVRRKLGYRRIELIGYFYGTRIVQQYLSRWPDRVSAAVLADMSPMDYPAAEAEAGALSASVASTLRACRADPACAARYPDLDGEWHRASSLLTRERMTKKAERHETGQPEAIDGTGILEWMKLRTLRWTSAASWPRDVDAITNGRLASVVQQYVSYRRTVLASYPLALRIAVDCAENMPGGRESLPNGSGAAAAERKICASWPVHRLARKFLRTPRTKVPILAISGQFDIEAPASAVRRAAARFSNAQLVIVPDRARGTDVDWGECMGPLVTGFLQTRGRGHLDARCVNRLKRPPFITSGAP
jgi:pimeloyl-ACP methyl ester carboxylesterase